MMWKTPPEFPIRYCPICAEVKALVTEHHSLPVSKYAVRCMNCKTLGPLKDSRKEAVAAWNDRNKPNPYEAMPRISDGHEKYCGKCRQYKYEKGCALWQCYVSPNDFCDYVDWVEPEWEKLHEEKP